MSKLVNKRSSYQDQAMLESLAGILLYEVVEPLQLLIFA
jgi:hypothetical protein